MAFATHYMYLSRTGVFPVKLVEVSDLEEKQVVRELLLHPLELRHEARAPSQRPITTLSSAREGRCSGGIVACFCGTDAAELQSCAGGHGGASSSAQQGCAQAREDLKTALESLAHPSLFQHVDWGKSHCFC